MILSIQPDEAIDSFIARNILVSPGDERFPSPAALRHEKCWSSSRLRSITCLLGPYGYGSFINSLKKHTALFIYPLDPKKTVGQVTGWYDKNKNIEPVIRRERIFVCVECARQDIHTTGYSYWRALHQFDTVVCEIHNLKLVTACPGCNLPFSMRNGNSKFLWEECRCGPYLLNNTAEQNLDSVELDYTRFYSDLRRFDGDFGPGEVLDAIMRRLNEVGKSYHYQTGEFLNHHGRNLNDRLRETFLASISPSVDSSTYLTRRYKVIAITALSLFGSFQNLLEYMSCLRRKSDSRLMNKRYYAN